MTKQELIKHCATGGKLPDGMMTSNDCYIGNTYTIACDDGELNVSEDKECALFWAQDNARLIWSCADSIGAIAALEETT